MNDGTLQWIVISDLDGTLLNHDTYSVNEAIDSIRVLQKNKIPVVFNTSKTYAETLAIRKQLDIHDPFIVENGSCIYLPVQQFTQMPDNAFLRDDYWAIMLGQSHQTISDILDTIDTPSSCYTRLSQCTVEQAINLTGLSHDTVSLAINREYSEPVIWHTDESGLTDFKAQLKLHDLLTLQGGRFLHILGKCDKGRSTQKLLGFYQQSVKSIILGDSANDTDMLSIADIPVIVNSPSNNDLLKTIIPVIQTTSCAPEGWSEAIHKALPDLFHI